MGLPWPFNANSSSVSAKKAPAEPKAPSMVATPQQAAAESATAQQPGDAQLLVPGPMPRPSSIFEFGEPVPVGGEVLRGMCAGSDPDAIQACTWTIDTAQGRGREKKPRYRVEF